MKASSLPVPTRVVSAVASVPAPAATTATTTTTTSSHCPLVMDRIPKFRRKPKPPAIETSIDRNIGSAAQILATNNVTSPPPSQHQRKPSKIAALRNLRLRGTAKRARDDPPAEIPVSSPPPPQSQPQPQPKPQPQSQPEQQQQQQPQPQSKPQPKPKPQPPSSSSTNITPKSPVLPNRPLRPTAQLELLTEKNKKKKKDSSISSINNFLSNNARHPPPQIPRFMTLSNQEIEYKFQELTWAERNRIAQGLRNEGIPDCSCPWMLYKQDDLQAQMKGVMDRYVNIKPWNYNRVKLGVPENELDYVNASSIVLESPSNQSKAPLRYIAMQGPTEPSFDYVWRMIAEQTGSPAVIVQLTNMFEAGALKCDQYFPFEDDYAMWDLNEGDAWGDGWKAQLTYNSLEEISDGAIEKRKMLLHVQGEDKPRVIWHLLYRRWPDFGVPTLEDFDTFLELMRLSRSLTDPSSARIIHCSAGVGRTGTFICLEHLIRELDSGSLERYDAPPLKEGPDLIYETVDLLRQQRRAMVQGDIQYKFIYQVMRKLWEDKYGIAEEDPTGSSEPGAKKVDEAHPHSPNGAAPSSGATTG